MAALRRHAAAPSVTEFNESVETSLNFHYCIVVNISSFSNGESIAQAGVRLAGLKSVGGAFT